MTSSRLGGPLGSQRPRVLTAPARASSAGQEAAELAAFAGLILDPWQQLLLEEALGERIDGQWAAFEVGILVARQNGKGGFIEARELAGLFLFDEQLIVHTAHEFPTAREAFRRIKNLIVNTRDLYSQVKHIHEAHGQEGIELRNGQRLLFRARTTSGGRGLSGDLVVLDEAQRLPETSVDALLPTMGARPNPQLIYTGTVPGPLDDATHWAGVRARGTAGTDSSLMWAEWSPKPPKDDARVADYDLDDRALWAAANPAYGIRRSEEALQRERNALSDTGFAREIMSIWPAPDERGPAIVDGPVWAALAVTPPPTSSNPDLVLAVSVSDKRRTSIGLAELLPTGLRVLELVDHRPGTDWVAARAAELETTWAPRGWVMDAADPGTSLLPDLLDVGIEPTLANTRQLAQACGGWLDAVTAPEPTVRHFAQTELDEAVAGAAKRLVKGGAFVLSRENSTVDVAPLIAVALALWGLSALEPPKPPPAAPLVDPRPAAGTDFNFLNARY